MAVAMVVVREAVEMVVVPVAGLVGVALAVVKAVSVEKEEVMGALAAMV